MMKQLENEALSITGETMQAYTYVSQGNFQLMEKPKPVLMHPRDAIVKVTLASICSSDLHIKHGSVPRAVPGITVGHEMVGIVESVGEAVTNVKPGDRVTVNVETFCGQCFFCKKGYVNNCTDRNGGWALGCRIDGGQAEYVRVPFADQGLNRIPEGVTDRQALLVGDVLATGFWAARISEITPEDTVLILGAGPTGICTLLCVMLKQPKHIIVCEKDENRLHFIQTHYPQVQTVTPESCLEQVRAACPHGGADVVLEVAGVDSTFRLAWQTQRAGDGGGALRPGADPAPAGDVRQEPDLQNRRRGRLRLPGDPGADCPGQAGHRAADYPHLSPEQNPGGLRPV